MGRYAKAAKRYVKAFFEWAQEDGSLETAARDMALIRDVLNENPELKAFLKKPVVSGKQKLAAVTQIFESKISDKTRRLLELLGEKNRLDILPDIVDLFDEYYKQYLGTVEATLITAVPVDDDLRQAFLEKVKEITGKDRVEFRLKTDPSIIGGYILQIGDLKVDDSIKGKLQKIKSKLIVQ